MSAAATSAVGACAPVLSCRRRAHTRNPIARTIAIRTAPTNQTAEFSRDGHRQIEAAVVKKDDVADADRLPRSRQRLENRVVPEQQQQQERRVAHDAGVNERKSRQQPVGRESRHADHETQQRRQRNADHRDEKGVEQPDPKGLSVGGLVGVTYQMEIDVEAGDIVPESEAHRNAASAHIDHGVVDRAASQRCDAPQAAMFGRLARARADR